MRIEHIEGALIKGEVDVGILVTPLRNKNLIEMPLFYEKFVAYISKSHPLYNKDNLRPKDMNVSTLWLLEEGYFFRNQVVNICALNKSRPNNISFKYEAGSIQTMKKLVEQNNGVTVLPELAMQDMSAGEKKLLRSFKKPEPAREVSLVTHRDLIKQQLIGALKEEITDTIPDKMFTADEKQVIVVEYRSFSSFPADIWPVRFH